MCIETAPKHKLLARAWALWSKGSLWECSYLGPSPHSTDQSTGGFAGIFCWLLSACRDWQDYMTCLPLPLWLLTSAALNSLISTGDEGKCISSKVFSFSKGMESRFRRWDLIALDFHLQGHWYCDMGVRLSL